MFTRKRKSEVQSDSHVTCVVRDFSVGGVADLSETISNGATNLAVSTAFPVGGLKMLSILATGGNLTLKTNSSGTPDDTLALVDGKKIEWTEDDLEACPLTSDVTSLFVTNASGASVLLEIFAGYDVTP